MATFQVVRERDIQYPYSKPTRAFDVMLRHGGKQRTFTVHTGGSGLIAHSADDLIAYLRELAEDAYLDYDEMSRRDMAYMLCEGEPTDEEYRMVDALAMLGKDIMRKLDALGLLEE